MIRRMARRKLAVWIIGAVPDLAGASEADGQLERAWIEVDGEIKDRVIARDPVIG